MLLLNTRVLGFFPGYAMVTLAMTLNMILKVKLPQVSFSKGKQQSFITDLKKSEKLHVYYHLDLDLDLKCKWHVDSESNSLYKNT